MPVSRAVEQLLRHSSLSTGLGDPARLYSVIKLLETRPIYATQAQYYLTPSFFGRCMKIFAWILVIPYISIVAWLPETIPAVNLRGSIPHKLPRVTLTTCVNTAHPAPGGLHAYVSANLPRPMITAGAQIGHTAPGGANYASNIPNVLARGVLN